MSRSGQRDKPDSNLSHLAYQQIKNKIITGEFKQGSLISISSLAGQLGISRTPITNACQQLEYEGFLNIVPKQGVVVKSITINDAREVYEMRAALETYCAKCAFPQIDENDIRYLESCYERQIRTVAQNDVYAFMQEDINFHKYLINKYDNSRFLSVLGTLYDRMFLMGLENVKKPARLQASLAEHRDIIDCLIHKDGGGYVEKTEQHVLNGFHSLTTGYPL